VDSTNRKVINVKISWLYRVGSFCLILNSFNAVAFSEADINALKGVDILYSSPFENGNKATKLNSENIHLSPDFIDDGNIIIEQKAYPIDQLFIKNTDGKYENLAYLLDYNGIANTYRIRYYDTTRLAIKDELERLKQQTLNCVSDYTGSGLETIADETAHFNICLDNIFYRVINLFYTQSEEQLIKNYKEQSDILKNLYFDLANPDNCYGRCGTIAQMRAYGQIIEAKQQFILNLLNNPLLMSK